MGNLILFVERMGWSVSSSGWSMFLCSEVCGMILRLALAALITDYSIDVGVDAAALICYLVGWMERDGGGRKMGNRWDEVCWWLVDWYIDGSLNE